MVLRQVWVVLWKNGMLRRRHWFVTICEIAIPVFLFFLVAYARSKINSLGKEIHEEPTYSEVYPSNFIYEGKAFESIYYTPKNEFTSELMEEIRKRLQIGFVDVKGFSNENELLADYAKNVENKSIIVLVFKGLVDGKTPKNLIYEIRSSTDIFKWDTNRLYFTSEQYTTNRATDHSRGILPIQLAVDTSFIEFVTNNNSLPSHFTFQEFPYPPYTNDLGVQDLFMYFLPFITLFSFILLCPALLKRIVEEKHTGIKELMKMVGLQSWMLWLGWFIHAFLVNVLSVIIIVFLMKVSLWGAEFPPIEFCSTSIYAVFLILYCAACITFCFTIAALFNRPTIAMIAGLLIWILTYFVPKAVIENLPYMRRSTKMLFALFPNMALHFGYSTISIYEVREVGANWSNICKSPSGDVNDVTMGDVFAMLMFDFVFYLLLALYIDGINPGPYGLRKPWHFPISALMFCKKKSAQISDEETNGYFEETPLNLAPGIRIRNLYKKYGKFEAVKGVSLDIYKDQITVLLGHNGAGKSTTMSMITGMIRPTHGTVSVLGNKVKTNASKFTKTLGLCPQHNLVFVDLTVMEHLLFFAMLKGLSLSQAHEDAADLLKRLGLYAKRNSLPGQLSGGMKRKLCLGMAIVGNSEILVLDEPTTGMDPEARRAVWDMLQSYRSSRTILITTHFMEEAEVLGDRIAIMSHGKIECYGSPMYLKNKYGTGYNLTIVRCVEEYTKADTEQPEDKRKEQQLQDILEEVRKVIPSAKVKASSGNIVTILLPMDSKPFFFEMLSNLEASRKSLGIENISVSVTTLEDLMLRIGKDETSSGQEKDSNSNGGSISSNLIKCSEPTNFCTKVATLLQKRWYVYWKNFGQHSIQCTVMIAVTLLTLYLGDGASNDSTKTERALNIDLGIYGRSTVYYSSQRGHAFQNIRELYGKVVEEEQRGIAAETGHVSNSLISSGKENIAHYKKHLIAAAEFNETGKGDVLINVMYSNFAVHGASISLNLAANALLKAVAGEEYSLFTSLASVQHSEAAIAKQAIRAEEVGVLWLILFPLGVLFMVGGLIAFPQLERMSNIVQLQFMSGIKSYIYWSTTFIFDFIYYTVAMIEMLTFAEIFAGFLSETQLFYGINEYVGLLVILLCYGFAVIPYTYLFSYKKSLAGAFALHLLSGLFLGVVLTVIVFVLQHSGDHYYENVGETLKYIFLIIPQFGLTYCLVNFTRKVVSNYNWDIMSESEKNRMCHFDFNPCCTDDLNACQAYRNYFRGNKFAVLNDLWIMVASAVIYFAILLFLESRLLGTLKDKILIAIEKIKEYNSPSKCCEVSSTDGQDDQEPLLEVTNLEKMYGFKKVVDGVTFSVKPGICFGLLGVNGAGKTTTFKMLTGDETLTRGSSIIRLSSGQKINLATDSVEYLRRMGYCPQFDAINDLLTGRQMLECFAKLRGVPKEDIAHEVNMLLDHLGLTEYADKPCGEYSGGNKRKLSIAIALIGEPPLLLLDEPTSGVDPASRRKMWKIISNIKENSLNTSVILTSHSMQECEVLCNSLAIMKEGKIYCQGTLPKLKEKYGKGYTILLKLKCSDDVCEDLNEVVVEDVDGKLSRHNSAGSAYEKDIAAVMDKMSEMYGSNCRLRDQHKCLLHYHIESVDKRWSTLFSEIESLKTQFSIIDDYTISDASLEDVFLEIAKRT